MSNKKNKYVFGALGFGFVLYLFILIITPKPIDWSLSFSKDDDIPYGSKILFDELKTLFDSSAIYTCHSPLYNFLSGDQFEKADLVIINSSFHPDKTDFDKITSHVKKGNNAFIAASEFSDLVLDSIGFDINTSFNIKNIYNDSITINLVNKTLKSPFGYTYKKAFQNIHFNYYDTLKTTVLGLGNKAKTNFIRVKYGQGNFFINLNPLAYTNFNLVSDINYEYAFKTLSYLPQNNKVIWDEYYKAKPRPSTSLLRYILSQKGLKYAWYILLFTIVTYLVISAKRNQRKIPVINPPRNTTLSFIETIGRLYFKRKNHLDIAQKRFKYFLEFLRTRYFIDTSETNEHLIQEISNKLDIPHKTIKKLFSQAERLRLNASYTEEDLEHFSKNIEYIYQKCKNK